MHPFTTFLATSVLLIFSFGCASPQTQSGASGAKVPEQPRNVNTPTEGEIQLIDIRFNDPEQGNRVDLLSARLDYTGRSEVVGIAGRLEAFLLEDGSEVPFKGDWKLLDADEISYARPTPVIQRGVLLHPRPWPNFVGVRLRVRAAISERIERITIDTFRTGQKQHADAHGLSLTVTSKLGKALGASPATLISLNLKRQGEERSDPLSTWGLSPDERLLAKESGIWVQYRFGFLDDQDALITPSGQGNGSYTFLGQSYDGRVFAADVPIGVRVVESVIELNR